MGDASQIFVDSVVQSGNQNIYSPNLVFLPESIFQVIRTEVPTSTTNNFSNELPPIIFSTTDQCYSKNDNSTIVFNDIIELINLVSRCQTENGMTAKTKFKDGYIFLENLKSHFENTQKDICQRDGQIAHLLEENNKLKEEKKYLKGKYQTIFLQFGMLRKKYVKIESELNISKNKTGNAVPKKSSTLRLTKSTQHIDQVYQIPQQNISSPTLTEQESHVSSPNCQTASSGNSADLNNLNLTPQLHHYANITNQTKGSSSASDFVINSRVPSHQNALSNVMQTKVPGITSMTPSYQHCMQWIANGINVNHTNAPQGATTSEWDSWSSIENLSHTSSNPTSYVLNGSNQTNVNIDGIILNDEYNMSCNIMPTLDLFYENSILNTTL